MRVLSRRAAIAMTLLLAACATPPAEVQHAQVAEGRAREWLAQIDAGDYAGSWDTAARLFQSRLSKQEWAATAGRVQPGLGKLMSRELVAAKYTTAMPWEPPGEHVLVQYRAIYGRRALVETLTMRYAADHQWRTVGYNIRWE